MTLADLLRRFFGEVNSKDGNPCSKSTLTGIRADINRHLQGPPTDRSIHTVTDKAFMATNKVFTGRLRIT